MEPVKVTKDESGRYTWKAVGGNPETGRENTIHGGQAGTPVGRKNPDSEQTFRKPQPA